MTSFVMDEKVPTLRGYLFQVSVAALCTDGKFAATYYNVETLKCDKWTDAAQMDNICNSWNSDADFNIDLE